MKDQYTCMRENKIKMIINLITHQDDGYSRIGVSQKVTKNDEMKQDYLLTFIFPSNTACPSE